jgi:hypothetical protein
MSQARAGSARPFPLTSTGSSLRRCCAARPTRVSPPGQAPARHRWPPPSPLPPTAPVPAAPPLQEAERPAWAVAKVKKRAAEVSTFLGKLTSSETLGPDHAGREYVRLAAMPKTAVVHAQVGAAAGGRVGCYAAGCLYTQSGSEEHIKI